MAVFFYAKVPEKRLLRLPCKALKQGGQGVCMGLFYAVFSPFLFMCVPELIIYS